MPITAWDLAHKKCFLAREETRFKILKLEVKIGLTTKYSQKWWLLVGQLDLLNKTFVHVSKMMRSLEDIIRLQPVATEYLSKTIFETQPLLKNKEST